MSEEIVICVRGLRWNGKSLQQLILMKRDGESVEEWQNVPQINPSASDAAAFWSGIDWNKTNAQVAVEYGYSMATISQKRAMYGFRSYKHTRVEWEGVDWNKSNSVIARELGRTIQMVLAARRARNIPVFSGRIEKRKIDQDRLALVDWEWETDASIGEKLGVTRERIRQLRIDLQKPACKVKWVGRGAEALKWLEEHRAELEGRSGHEIVRMMPGDIQVPSKYKMLKRSGIRFTRGVWGRPWQYGNEGERPLNWKLPTKWLALIWNMSPHQVSQRRMLINAGQSLWHGGGFSRYLDDPEFIALITSEMRIATDKGIDVDVAKINAEMEFQRAAVRRIQQKAQATKDKTLDHDAS
jgi:hypothetical protein